MGQVSYLRGLSVAAVYGGVNTPAIGLRPPLPTACFRRAVVPLFSYLTRSSVRILLPLLSPQLRSIRISVSVVRGNPGSPLNKTAVTFPAVIFSLYSVGYKYIYFSSVSFSETCWVRARVCIDIYRGGFV